MMMSAFAADTHVQNDRRGVANVQSAAREWKKDISNTEGGDKMKIEFDIEQADELLKSGNYKIKAAVLEELKKEEKRLLVELAKNTLMLDALNTGDYSNLSNKLITEMNEIGSTKLLLEKNP